MTKSRNGYNGKSSKKKLILVSEEHLDLLRMIDPSVEVIHMPSGLYNPKKFYTKPELRAIGDSVGDLDGFTHYNGHHLLMEFKPSTRLSKDDKIQICSQLCLVLENRATYWIVEWKYSPEGRFEVSEILEVAPDGELSIITINVGGLRKMCDDWRDHAKNNFKRSCKWKQAEKIFEKLKNREDIKRLDKRSNKDDDNADGEIAAI